MADDDSDGDSDGAKGGRAGGTRFSANLGFLWTELPLPAAIRCAARAGFDAVECHWPFDTPASEVAAALAETGLPLLSLNTRKGPGPQDMGLAAVPGREAEARAAIEEALDYAAAAGAGQVHVMAGRAEGAAARAAFLANLRFAADGAAARGLGVLIEPLNARDAPGYFLRRTAQAAEIVEELGLPEARILFDCYHAQATEGDVTRRLEGALHLVGHVQIAGAPDRGRPDEGELNLRHVLRALRNAGWTRPVGAEYRPRGPVEAELDWMRTLRA